jgi:hypothetical protein
MTLLHGFKDKERDGRDAVMLRSGNVNGNFYYSHEEAAAEEITPSSRIMFAA